MMQMMENDAAANVGTVATAPTSSDSRHELGVYMMMMSFICSCRNKI